MGWILGIATLVGGVAGVIYLYEKWSGNKTAEPKPIVVDFNYPTTSGLQQQLNKQGYQMRWSRADKIASRKLDGWEIVVEDVDGRKRSFVLRDGLMLIKIKQPNIRIL